MQTDLDYAHNVGVDVHLKYAGKSEKREVYKVKTLNETEAIIYTLKNYCYYIKTLFDFI